MQDVKSSITTMEHAYQTRVCCPGRAALKAEGDVVAPYITNVARCKEMGKDSKNKASLDY